ncbi:MAG: FHA domain-containing protein [Planctomycetes bacterium]|nr:FHA domain-containing protein [Planctomycetota bacterium]
MPSEFGQLVPVEGGKTLPLHKTRCVVGRAPDCDVVLSFRTVSSKHCLLELRDDSWFVTDLASSNGIRIDGERCAGGKLANHSVLSIAEFRYEVVYSSSVPQLPASSPRAVPGDLNSEISQLSATEMRPKPGSSDGQPPTEKIGSRSLSAEARGPLAGPIFGKLLPVDGGDEIVLTAVRLLVGRSPVCDIVLPFPEVSGKHCQLEFADDRWHVRDLGSRNGILVDGKPTSSAMIRPNAILSVAKRRFKLAYDLKVPDPVKPPENRVAPAIHGTLDLEEIVPPDSGSIGDLANSLFSGELPANQPLEGHLSGSHESI